jgi:membrane protease YdiL (CAAX protease family)
MIPALMVLGMVVEGVAWWWISARGASVWAVMTPVLVGLGIVALLAGDPHAATEVGLAAATAAGLGAGLLLYAATRVFVTVVAPRWRAFRAQSVSMYGRRGRRSLALVLGLSVLLMVPGEELFWRGLFLPELQRSLDTVPAAAAAWAGFVAANLPSRNLAIVAGAMVGGAAWVSLAAWSGGVLAGLLCHAAWTALMLAFPPLPTPEGGAV